jgi:flagellin
MTMAVRTNIAAIMASGQLGKTNTALSSSLGRISSGLRINSAADDAAGLGVATNLETQVNSTRQAIRNSNDGISIIQTAEGATNEVTDILQRMRELAVQSSSETLDNDERAYIQTEFTQLTAEVARISNVTEFNGISLANNSVTSLDVQVGINNSSNDRISITLGDLRATSLGVDTGAINLATASGAQAALTTIDTALDSVNSIRSTFGAVQNRLDSAINNATVSSESLSGARSAIQDTDFATETSNLTRLQIMQQAGVASLAQAKNINQSVISLLS